MAHIAAVEVALPAHVYSQEQVTAELIGRLAPDDATKTVIERVHQATGVSTRHLGQMGVSQRPQDSPVSVSGCAAHFIEHPSYGAIHEASLVPRISRRAFRGALLARLPSYARAVLSRCRAWSRPMHSGGM